MYPFKAIDPSLSVSNNDVNILKEIHQWYYWFQIFKIITPALFQNEFYSFYITLVKWFIIHNKEPGLGEDPMVGVKFVWILVKKLLVQMNCHLVRLRCCNVLEVIRTAIIAYWDMIEKPTSSSPLMWVSMVTIFSQWSVFLQMSQAQELSLSGASHPPHAPAPHLTVSRPDPQSSSALQRSHLH